MQEKVWEGKIGEKEGAQKGSDQGMVILEGREDWRKRGDVGKWLGYILEGNLPRRGGIGEGKLQKKGWGSTDGVNQSDGGTKLGTPNTF